MVDEKISQLTPLVSFTADAAFEVSNDLGGTPVTNRASITQVLNYVETNITFPVDSVNGQTGVVVLDTGDIAEVGNLYFTDERAQDAVGGILVDTGNIDFTYDDATPAISASIAATYVGQTSITTLGTITTGTWNGTDIAVADGGTGASDAATARANLGVAIGTDVQAHDAELDAIAALASTGLIAHTAAGAAAERTITGTANRITVTNGNGVSGNPVIDIDPVYESVWVKGIYIETVADGDYVCMRSVPEGFTITDVKTESASGTCTATFKINTTALGGTANSVSSTPQTQSHATANDAVANDDINVTVSSNSTCLGMIAWFKIEPTV